MRKNLLSLCAFIIVTFFIAMAADIEVSTGKVFVSDDGVKVFITYLKSGGKPNGKALIKVTDANSIWDNKIFLHVIHEYDNKADFTTQYKGKDYVSVYAREGLSSNKRYHLSLPDKSGEIALTFSEKETEKFKPDTLLKAYLKSNEMK